MPLKRKHSYKSKTQTGVAEHLVLWAVEATQAARQSLLNAKSTGSIPEFNAASARFAAVLEELPELWPELSDELMQAVWLGFDEAMRTRLAEGAAGSLFGGERPCNLPQLLCLISRALTDEGRYWTARSLLHRARRVAQRHGISESLVCASLADMHCRAVPPWHFHMLNDQPRNQAFAASIGDALRELAARTARVEPVTCLDIGTGTGLLALICQQLGSELGMPKLQIHACEENELLFAMASELINSAQSTGLEEKEHVFFAQVELKEVKPTVILHRANSRNLEVPPVDLIFCEAVDAELVGEGFLQTALDACERLLKPDGRLIPSSATLFGQLVECPCLQARFGCDHFQLTSVQLRENFVCDFLENLEHKILSGPAELMHIPFDKPKDLRCQLGFVHFVELQALQSGTAHAVMVWWELRLDKHGRHKISSRPGREENHWPQVFWPVHAEAHVSDEEAEPAVLPKLGRTLLASECVALQLRLLEDRLECKPRTFGPSKVPKSKFKISSGDLQWLNDAQVWECLKQQCQAIKVYGYGALLDGSALVQPAALLTAASSLDAAPTVRAAVANGNLEAIEAFLRANSFGDEPVLFPDSPVDDAVKLALSSEAFGKAASIILVLSDVVKRSGEVRSELLHKVCVAHQHCAAVGKQLTVAPSCLQLTLTPIESTALARRSRVLQPVQLCSGARIDVCKINAFSPSSFDSLSEEALKRLAVPQVVFRLQLSTPSLDQLLGQIHGQKFRLGPAICCGHIHGVVCEWSWCLPDEKGVQLFTHFLKAGTIWREKDCLLHVGDFVMVEAREDVRGFRLVPLGICAAGNKSKEKGPSTSVNWRSNKWVASQRKRARSAGRLSSLSSFQEGHEPDSAL